MINFIIAERAVTIDGKADDMVRIAEMEQGLLAVVFNHKTWLA